MFLQVLKELHGGFRRIGAPEIHSVMMTGALREKFPNLASHTPKKAVKKLTPIKAKTAKKKTTKKLAA
jgi:hypothetical protein